MHIPAVKQYPLKTTKFSPDASADKKIIDDEKFSSHACIWCVWCHVTRHCCPFDFSLSVIVIAGKECAHKLRRNGIQILAGGEKRRFCKSNDSLSPTLQWQTLEAAELQPHLIKRSIKCAALALPELVAYLKIICCSGRLCNILPPSSEQSLIIKSEQHLLGSRTQYRSLGES